MVWVIWGGDRGWFCFRAEIMQFFVRYGYAQELSGLASAIFICLVRRAVDSAGSPLQGFNYQDLLSIMGAAQSAA